VEKSRYNIIQGLKYWRQVQQDPASKVYLLKHYPPNANRDFNRGSVEPAAQDSGGRTCKVAEIGRFIFCACMEYFNTGLPCVH